MKTQFVIKKPVTKVFKAFNESLWYPTRNLHWRINDLYIVTNDRLDKHSWSLHSSPMDVLTLLAIYLKCSPKFYFSSKNKPRCFWYWVCITWLLLKINSGWLGFLIFWEKITSWASVEGSGLKLIIHWYAQLLIFIGSLFKVLADKFVSEQVKIEKCHQQKARIW